MRFCPSCGFRLDGVDDLLARDGLPTNPVTIWPSPELSERKRGIRRGAKITFTGIVMFMAMFPIAIDKSPEPLIIPFTIFITGFFWMLYHRLFGLESPPVPKQPQHISAPVTQQVYLAQQSIPVYRPPVETPRPQSVVENTTRSLGSQ
jgi:hypothetical protein